MRIRSTFRSFFFTLRARRLKNRHKKISFVRGLETYPKDRSAKSGISRFKREQQADRTGRDGGRRPYNECSARLNRSRVHCNRSAGRRNRCRRAHPLGVVTAAQYRSVPPTRNLRRGCFIPAFGTTQLQLTD